MVERLQDGLQQELKKGFIALQFKTTRELIEAAQTLEACIEEGQSALGMKKDVDLSSCRPPFSKKGQRSIQLVQAERRGNS